MLRKNGGHWQGARGETGADDLDPGANLPLRSSDERSFWERMWPGREMGTSLSKRPRPGRDLGMNGKNGAAPEWERMARTRTRGPDEWSGWK
jgi:hypothetical protein